MTVIKLVNYKYSKLSVNSLIMNNFDFMFICIAFIGDFENVIPNF